MNNFYIFLLITLIFSNSTQVRYPLFEKNTTIELPLNQNLIPGLPPELSPVEIDLIKVKAKDFIPEPVSKNDIIVMETNFGIMEFLFYNNEAPNHCHNFKKIANSGFYDKTIFHRIIPGFMAQGGDILTRDSDKDNDGIGNPGWTVNQEFNNISHVKGILSMARSQDINSAGSQFFICFDNAPHLNNKYTVFGKLTKGYDVLSKIESLESEASFIINQSLDNIPADSQDSFFQFKYKNKFKYIKIPKYQDKDKFKLEINNKLKNIHRTQRPVKIKKIRIKNKNESISN